MATMHRLMGRTGFLARPCTDGLGSPSYDIPQCSSVGIRDRLFVNMARVAENHANVERRQFLGSTVAVVGLAMAPATATAIEPIARTGPSHIRLSIAGYSYRKYLDLKIKPRPPMTLFDLVDLAAQMNLDAVEPTAYYFPETTPAYLAQLKGRCSRLGLDVSGTAVGNNFCVADPKKLRTEIEQVKRLIEHSSRLGAKTMRIFAGTVAKGDTEEAARQRTIEAIQEACDYAGQFGIILALENHGGIVATPTKC